MYYINYISIVVLSSIFLGCNFQKTDNRNSNDSEVSSNDILETTQDERGYIVKIGDMAPDFEMSLPNGEKVILSSLKDKVVMLQFTASWCGVCRKEMPYIESEIWRRHQNNPDFVLFGIDREEPVEKIEELINKT